MTDPTQTEKDSAFLSRQEAKLGEMNGGLRIPEMPTDPPDDTPRTDAAKWRSDSGIALVVAVLAEQLERELTAANTHIAELEAQLRESEARVAKFGALEEQLESYKTQWKRHYADEADAVIKARYSEAFDAIYRLGEVFGVDEYTPTTLAAEIEKQRTELQAREVVLREALVDYKGRCRECGGSGAYLTEGSDEEPPDFRQCQWCDHALIALHQPAPPVVAKAVADGLAEALAAITAEAKAVSDYEPRPSKHHRLIAEAHAALAAYKEASEKL